MFLEGVSSKEMRSLADEAFRDITRVQRELIGESDEAPPVPGEALRDESDSGDGQEVGVDGPDDPAGESVDAKTLLEPSRDKVGRRAGREMGRTGSFSAGVKAGLIDWAPGQK